MPNSDITNIPAPRVPLVDSEGLISKEWYRYLYNLFILAGSGGNNVSLDDLQLGPPPQDMPAGGVVTVTGTPPIYSSGGSNPDISITKANSTTNGYLSYTDWITFNNKANSGANSDITSLTGITGGISTPDYIAFDTAYATTLTAGQLGWDGNNTLGIGMAGGNVIQHIGEDQFFYCKATSAITKGQVAMFTGAVGASGVPTGAPATSITDGTYIMGIAAENIATNGFGLVQSFGTLRNVNTSGYADGDILWYDPSVAGGLTNVKPSAPNVKVQMAAVINGGSSGGGTILIRINPGSTLGGTDSNAQITSPTNGQILTYDNADAYWKNTNLTAGTGISVSAASDGTLTVTNTSPSSGGTVTSVSGTGSVNGITLTGTVTSSGSLTLGGTLGSIANSQLTNSSITINGNSVSLGGSTTVTATATNALTIGTGLSGTSYNGSAPVTIANTGVLSVTGTAPVSASTVAGATTVSMAAANSTTNGYLTSTDWNTFNNKQPSGTYVNSVSATSPVVSSGGTTPTISMPAATGSVNGYLTSTDWTTFNNKQPAGSYLTAVTADAPLSGSGTSASHLVISQATTSTNGYLSSTDWNTFNNKQPSGTYVNSVTGTAPIVSSGGTTPAISMAAATGSVNGYLTSTDWNTFNNKQAALVSGTNIKTVNGTSLLGSGDLGTIGIAYGGTGQTTKAAAFDALSPTTTQGDIIYYNGTTNTRLPIGANTYVLTSNGTTVSWAAPSGGSSNITTKGMWENSKTISANYAITSGNSAVSAGPITVSSGVTVTVPSGSRWVIV